MGGAAGHMAHLHDNIWMTFGEIKSFLSSVARADIAPVEKVDGQNLFFRYNNGEIITARNAGDISRGGLSREEYMAKWNNHPAAASFVKGYEVIEASFNRASPEKLERIFSAPPGKVRYINCEIMYASSPNLIVYDGNYIAIHNIQEFDLSSGKARLVDVNLKESVLLKELLALIENQEKIADKKEWQIFGPQYVALKNIADGIELQSAYDQLDSLGYSDNNKLEDYLIEKLENHYLLQLDLPLQNKNLLIKRIVQIGNNVPTAELASIRKIKGGLKPNQLKAVTLMTSVIKAKKIISRILLPLAKIISDFAIEVLKGLHSFFITDGNEEVLRMRSELSDSINILQNYSGKDSESYGNLLSAQLEKLGPIENIASTVEGLVFEYPPGSKQLVKLTGAFAMANQIIGRAKRLPQVKESILREYIRNLLIESIDQQSVAIVAGAFKPPHLGHLRMVEHYSQYADIVRIVISDPKSIKSQRSIAGGGPITAHTSKRLWEILINGKSNVIIEVSDAPSPVTVAYDSIMPSTSPYPAGTKIYLGASVKGGDIKRYSYALKKADPKLNVMDPAVYAAPASKLPDQYIKLLMNSDYYENLPSILKGVDPLEYSASDLRYLLGFATNDPIALKLASFYVGKDNISEYISAIF